MRKMSVAEDLIVVGLFRVSRSFWHPFFGLFEASAKLDASINILWFYSHLRWLRRFRALHSFYILLFCIAAIDLAET